MIFIKNTDKLTKINLLERWILFHSYLYYEKNNSVVSDNMYDNNAKQLIHMITRFPVTFKKSRYYKFFVDYDGNTGMQLVNMIKKSKKLTDMLEFDIKVMSLKK